jgi:hypothetical protein
VRLGPLSRQKCITSSLLGQEADNLLNLDCTVPVYTICSHGHRDNRGGAFSRLAGCGAVRPGPRGWSVVEV